MTELTCITRTRCLREGVMIRCSPHVRCTILVRTSVRLREVLYSLLMWNHLRVRIYVVSRGGGAISPRVSVLHPCNLSLVPLLHPFVLCVSIRSVVSCIRKGRASIKALRLNEVKASLTSSSNLNHTSTTPASLGRTTVCPLSLQ